MLGRVEPTRGTAKLAASKPPARACRYIERAMPTKRSFLFASAGIRRPASPTRARPLWSKLKTRAAVASTTTNPLSSRRYYPASAKQDSRPNGTERCGGLANAFRMRSVTSRSARAGRSSQCVAFMVSVFACRVCHSCAVACAVWRAISQPLVQSNCTVREVKPRAPA
jgi:hypothetical protein